MNGFYTIYGLPMSARIATEDMLSADSRVISGSNVALNTITGANIASQTLQNRHFSDNSIEGGRLSVNTVLGSKIKDGAISANKLSPEVANRLSNVNATSFIGPGMSASISTPHGGLSVTGIDFEDGTYLSSAVGLMSDLSAKAQEIDYLPTDKNGNVIPTFEMIDLATKINQILSLLRKDAIPSSDIEPYVPDQDDSSSSSSDDSSSSSSEDEEIIDQIEIEDGAYVPSQEELDALQDVISVSNDELDLSNLENN